MAGQWEVTGQSNRGGVLGGLLRLASRTGALVSGVLTPAPSQKDPGAYLRQILP